MVVPNPNDQLVLNGDIVFEAPEIPPPPDHPPHEEEGDHGVGEEELDSGDESEGGEQEDQEQCLCRVCHAEIDLEEELDDLLSPCRCMGSMAFVHRECFERMQRNRCEICRFRYVAGEPPAAEQQNGGNLPGMMQFDINFERPEEANQQAQRLFHAVLEGIVPEDREGRFPIKRLILMVLETYFKVYTRQYGTWKFNWSMMTIYLWTLREAARVQSFPMFRRFGVIYLITTMMMVITYTTMPILYGLFWIKRSWRNLLLYGGIFASIRLLFRLYDQPDAVDWLAELIDKKLAVD